MNLDRILGLKWKILTGIAAVSFAVAGYFLVMAQVENRHLVKQNAQLDARINDRSTGYISQLAQATTNVKQLEVALDTQNSRLREQAAAADMKLGELTRYVSGLERSNAALRADSAKILNGKPRGDNLTARVTDIDNRLLETLK